MNLSSISVYQRWYVESVDMTTKKGKPVIRFLDKIRAVSTTESLNCKIQLLASIAPQVSRFLRHYFIAMIVSTFRSFTYKGPFRVARPTKRVRPSRFI
jgi:hypothetical protein